MEDRVSLEFPQKFKQTIACNVKSPPALHLCTKTPEMRGSGVPTNGVMLAANGR